MIRLLARSVMVGLVGLAVASCNGTTGDQLITFSAYASGARGASEPFSVNGYTVKLTFAQMYIGAVYVDQAPLATASESPICINPGLYAAQVPGGVEVNLLSTTPQAFAAQGSGTADVGQSWELWLTDGDVNSPDNTGFGVANTVDLRGTATRQSDGKVFSFAATVNIDQDNRGVPVSDPSQPGQNPICKQRIVELGGISLQLFDGGALQVTVDPRGWFDLDIDFSTLPLVTSGACDLDQNSLYGDAQYCIPDTNFGEQLGPLGATQGRNLYTGLFTAGPAAYSLGYSEAP